MRWTLGTKASSAQGRTCSECSGWGGRPGRAARGASRGPSRTERLAETLDSAPVARAGRKTDAVHSSIRRRPRLAPSLLPVRILSPSGITSVIAGSRARSASSAPGTCPVSQPKPAPGLAVLQFDGAFFPAANAEPFSSSFLSHSSPSSVALYPPPLHPDHSFPLSSTVDCR